MNRWAAIALRAQVRLFRLRARAHLLITVLLRIAEPLRDDPGAVAHRGRERQEPLVIDARDRPRDADARRNFSTLVEDRRRDAARAQAGFFVVHGIAMLRDARELFAEARQAANR